MTEHFETYKKKLNKKKATMEKNWVFFLTKSKQKTQKESSIYVLQQMEKY